METKFSKPNWEPIAAYCGYHALSQDGLAFKTNPKNKTLIVTEIDPKTGPRKVGNVKSKDDVRCLYPLTTHNEWVAVKVKFTADGKFKLCLVKPLNKTN